MKLNFNNFKKSFQSLFSFFSKKKNTSFQLDETSKNEKKIESKVSNFNNSRQVNSKKENKGEFWKVFLKTLGFLFSTSIDLCLIGVLAGITVFLYTYYNTINAEALIKKDIFQTTIIYDKTGQHILYELHGEENRKVVGHNEISDYMRKATIAAEDDAFYSHIGIDILGISRAAYKNFIKGSKSQGGSTITQQLVRNKFLSNDKTYERKFKEIVLSIKMERHYEKEQILDFYLNEVPYGSNAYGVQKASEVFFGKNANELTLDEVALLASLPKGTSEYSPYRSNTEKLLKRQKSILNRMEELGMYNDKVIEEALKIDTLAKLKPKGHQRKMDVPYFTSYVVDQLEKQFGEEKVRQGGFKIYTTLDYEMQKRAEQDVKEYANELPKMGASNASLVAIEPKTGGILAMVGGIDFYETKSGEVNVTLSNRQPGSSFKPIVYAAAFDKGYQPETLLYDVPTSFGEDGGGSEYKPNNYNGKTNGLVSMRKALAGSLNIPAVKTLYLVGIDNAIDFAETLGITTLKERNRFGLSLVLGSGEVKLTELVGAFSVFANDGEFASEKGKAVVHGINRIVDSHGKEIYNAPKVERIIDAEVARKITSILTDNEARTYIFGKNSVIYIPDKKVAVKTGTTQSSRDALTVGYTPNLAVGVWVGNNDDTAMKYGVMSTLAAAPLWRKFMEREIQNYPDTQFVDYEKNVSVKSMVTGFLNGNSFSGGSAIYFNKKTGEQISEEKARKTDPEKLEKRYTRSGGGHSILYYIDKDNPLDPTAKPNYNDEMLWRWDSALGHSSRKP